MEKRLKNITKKNPPPIIIESDNGNNNENETYQQSKFVYADEIESEYDQETENNLAVGSIDSQNELRKNGTNSLLLLYRDYFRIVETLDGHIYARCLLCKTE